MKVRRPLLALLVGLLMTLAGPAVWAGERTASSIETIAGGEANDVAGPEFSFGGIAGLATDSFGNTYFTIQALSRVYRLGANGRVTVYAGNGIQGQAHDGAPAISSPLLNPASLAVDPQGNLFIACARTLVRVDASTGILSIVLLIPYRQPGSANSITDLGGMTFGPGGLLYICGGFRIQTYSFATGAVNIVAGNGSLGATQPGASATTSPLKYPESVAIARDGTLYFATLEPAVFRVNQLNNRIEKIDLPLVKDGPPPGDYDIPNYIAADGLGHLFVAQGNRSRILRIRLKTRYVSRYAGTGAQGFNGDEIKARLATTTIPTFVASDAAGNVTIGEQYRIRRVDASSRLISTIVGNGLPGSDIARTPARRAQLWEPANVVPAGDGSLYVISSFSQRVQRIGLDGNVTTVVGGGEPILGPEPGPALQMSLDYPQGIWVGENGDVYFSDYDNTIVRQLSVQSGAVRNFAKTPKNSNSTGMFLYYAAALVGNGNYLYLSDPYGHRVWRISRSEGTVEAYAGTGSDTQKPDGEDALSVRLIAPQGLELDASGNLYIADGTMFGKQGRILRVEPGSGRVTTVVGDLRQPSGLAFQAPGVLCFSESGASQVRCVDLESHSIRIVAGTGVAGFRGDGGPAECAELNRPSGISFDSMGNLYVADTGNQRVRMVRLGTGSVRCKE